MPLMPKDINCILSEFDIGRVKLISPCPTSVNEMFLVETDTGKYVLRLCPPGPGASWRSEEEIIAELELIDYLAANKFPVPVPVAKKNQERVVAWQNRFGCLRIFCEGEADLDPTIDKVRVFGKTFGWFHRLVKDYKTRHRRMHTWGPENTKRYFSKTKSLFLKSNFREKKRFIEEAEAVLASLRFPAHLPEGTIHEDLGRRHVLWRDGKISCVLDFDRSYYGKLILDLGQTIRGWCFVDNWRKWSEKNFRALTTSYQDGRKLTDGEKTRLLSAIKFGVLERALSFGLRSINRRSLLVENEGRAEYARHSLFNLISILESKEDKINKFLKELK